MVVPQERFFFVDADQLEDQADFGGKGDADVLAVELCFSVLEEGLELDAEVAVVSVVDLAL